MYGHSLKEIRVIKETKVYKDFKGQEVNKVYKDQPVKMVLMVKQLISILNILVMQTETQ